jgi:FixJ family two-component response regulator
MSSGTVLVVDDDPSVRETLRIILQRAGFEVLSAADGQEAISLMQQGDHAATVNTVLCDLDMPGVKGQTLITHLHTQYPLIPITVMSGADAFVFTEAVGKQGVTDWIRKPASREAVLEKVRVAVRLHQLRQADSGSPRA